MDIFAPPLVSIQFVQTMSRVDKNLFEEDHYLGKPADATDLLVSRRLELLEGFEGFFDSECDLIEIGCGNGNTTVKVAPRFRSARGLEYASVHQVEFESLAREAGVSEKAQFEVCDIMAGPVSPKAQRLISFEVIEHLPGEEGVRNYAASLEDGALAAISVPNKWWVFETHGARLPLLPWNRVPFFSWLPRPLHERWANARIYTRSRIVRLMEESGFEVLKTQYITAPMDVIKWKPLQQFLRRWVFGKASTRNPLKSVSILVFARKRASL
ncbi:MAG: hypothetical protein RL577_911 [Bacteroidota bacterium]|jgi:SAM-dependent methyltransferase